MNTDDYEGHTHAPWEITEYIDHIVVSETKSNEVNGVDAALIAAAPDLLAEVIHSRKLLAHIARDESITIVGYDGTRYTPDGTYGTEESE